MVHRPVDVEVTFTNPLSDVVTDCVLRAEGSGLLKEQLQIQYVNASGWEFSGGKSEVPAGFLKKILSTS